MSTQRTAPSTQFVLQTQGTRRGNVRIKKRPAWCPIVSSSNVRHIVPPSPRRARARTWFIGHLLQRSSRPRPRLHTVLHRPLLTAANQHLVRHLHAVGLHIATLRSVELILPPGSCQPRTPLGLHNHSCLKRTSSYSILFISTSLLSDVTAVSATGHLRHCSLSAPIVSNFLPRYHVRKVSCLSNAREYFRGHSLSQNSGKPHIKIMVDRGGPARVYTGLRKVDCVLMVSFEGGVLMCSVYCLVSKEIHKHKMAHRPSQMVTIVCNCHHFPAKCALDKMTIGSLQSLSCNINL